ncbi:MAG: hypothetical protein KME10_27950 [Plectolyngbya sp. WJT66-NPBG17]|jgi:hypothetical protein|nr:hypothetical protein [Plectolyngbya sp. WJT66-NPBG17]
MDINQNALPFYLKIEELFQQAYRIDPQNAPGMLQGISSNKTVAEIQRSQYQLSAEEEKQVQDVVRQTLSNRRHKL